MCCCASVKRISYLFFTTLLLLLSHHSMAAKKMVNLPILANTCLGKMKLNIVKPTRDEFRWRSTLTLANKQRLNGYFTHKANGPVDTTRRLQKTFPEYEARITQTGKDKFVLKKRDRADCDIEIVEYGVLAPQSNNSNLYGMLVVPMLLVVDEEANPEDEYTWGSTTPEVEDENWAWGMLMQLVDLDSGDDSSEVIGGYNNVWENPDQKDDTPDASDDVDEDGKADGDYDGNGVVTLEEELRWLGEVVSDWYNRGGILRWL